MYDFYNYLNRPTQICDASSPLPFSVRYCIFKYLAVGSVIVVVRAVNVCNPPLFPRDTSVAAKESMSCRSALLAQVINLLVKLENCLSFGNLHPMLSKQRNEHFATFEAGGQG